MASTQCERKFVREQQNLPCREKGTWTINLSNLKFEVIFQFLIKIG